MLSSVLFKYALSSISKESSECLKDCLSSLKSWKCMYLERGLGWYIHAGAGERRGLQVIGDSLHDNREARSPNDQCSSRAA